MRFLKFLVVLCSVVVIGAVVVWRVPAAWAYEHAGDRLAPLMLTGLHGTLWQGHAADASVLGHPLGALDWTLHKLPLLRGRLVATVNLQGSDLQASGSVERAPGELTLRGIRFHLPATLIAPARHGDPQAWRGSLEGSIDEVRMQGAMLIAARGQVRWSRPGIPALPELALPDLLADFAAQPDGSVAGSVRDDGGGRIAVDGQFKLRIGLLDAAIVLRARPGHPLAARALERIGEPQADGSRRVVLHETWP
ncbi:type II secretion system protein N [Dokdonella sp.]|uniref:type II secretion system protein N n=1 Tax=Dokdonella sp. TaxID=2291710 RepID=UPI0031BD538A|nr:type II secretion system protein N [Dokdonella sp.]